MVGDVTHREIYDRLVAVEGKVDAIIESTKDVPAQAGFPWTNTWPDAP